MKRFYFTVFMLVFTADVFAQNAMVSGFKFHDVNANGSPDAGEPLLEGWIIYSDINGNGILEPNEEPNTATDATGSFSLLIDQNLPGTHHIREVIPEGWVQTYPLPPDGHIIELQPDTGYEAFFGNTYASTVKGIKWADFNGDGVMDPDEPGVEGWEVTLEGTSSINTEVNLVTLTDRDGRFEFKDILPGTYFVKELIREGWIQTYPLSSIHEVFPNPGEIIEDINFGNQPPDNLIRGQKVIDKNGDGQRDNDEVGMDGVTIRLLDTNGVEIVTTVTTSVDLDDDGVIDPITEQGLFTFENVPPGNYRVGEVVPAGWEQTDPLDPDYFAIVLVQDILEGLVFLNVLPPDEWDYGDLPDTYVTLRATGGARHGGSGPTLGTKWDWEGDGQPHPLALGDDDTNIDDEDGVVTITQINHPVLGPTVYVEGAWNDPARNNAFLSAWMDIDGDGTFCLGCERIEHNMPLFAPVGPGPWPWVIMWQIIDPHDTGGFVLGALRVRISYSKIDFPDGPLPTGEVEDYLGFGLDYGDALDEFDPNAQQYPGGYPTLDVQDGARHLIWTNYRMGESVTDAEQDGQPSQLANGDDNFKIQDEDGIQFEDGFAAFYIGPDPDNTSRVMTIYGIQQGSLLQLKPLAKVSGLFNAWFDWNRDGDWDDDEEHVFDDEDVESGPNYTTLYLNVPETANLGYTNARFRFSTQADLDYDGFAINGEVEDYIFVVTPQLDWGDAPIDYPTLAYDGGARHVIGSYYLGVVRDADVDGQPDPDALGDDNDDPVSSIDDEDGIVFPTTPLIRGENTSIQVTATTPVGQFGYLNAWIDFNQDNEWTNDEQVLTDEQVSDGTSTLTFAVPLSALPGITFARFRFSEKDQLGPTDPTPFEPQVGLWYGEVEDYKVEISSSATDVGEEIEPPDEFKLYDNYPNPFNPYTNIRYDVKERSFVSLKVYNVLGELVDTVVEREQAPGRYNIHYDAGNLPSGVYIYRIIMGNFRESKVMTVVK